MIKRVIAAFMIVVMLFCFAGCGAATTADNSTTHTITDLLGRERITVEKSAVSLGTGAAGAT